MTSTGSPPSPILEIENLRRCFGESTVLDGVTLRVQPGEFFTLLGPSGCGKTTLLRLIAGLDQADAGSLRIDGREMRGVPAHARPVHTVFQSYALFPHLNVRENVAFGLRMKGVDESSLRDRVTKALEWVQASNLGDRRTDQLSGGQKQRIALARAAVNEPRILLLDEPLAALDLKLRQQLQEELRQLQRRLSMTFIYVTHDQEEAFALSDRVAILNRGRLEQIGTPRALYESPANVFVAHFFGGCNLIPARLEKGLAHTSLGPLEIADTDPIASSRADLQLGIRPEEIRFAGPGQSSPNLVDAVVTECRFLGSETRWQVLAGGIDLRILSHGDANIAPRTPGETVRIELPSRHLRRLVDTRK